MSSHLCPHCKQQIDISITAGTGASRDSGGSSTSGGAKEYIPEGEAEEVMNFLLSLDIAREGGLELSEFDSKFVYDNIERSKKYKSVRFTRAQVTKIVNRLRKQYGDAVRGVQPKQSAKTSSAPSESAEEKPKEDPDGIPF